MAEAASSTALIQNDIVLFGLIAATLGVVFWTSSRDTGFWKKFYGWVPALQLLCDYLGLPMPASVEDLVEFHLLQRAARRKAVRIAKRSNRNRTPNCA